MTISSRPNISFPFQDLYEGDLDHISDDQLIYAIVSNFHPNRCEIASRQLESYFNQIRFHQKKIDVYIIKIKQLIELEKTRGAKSE